MRCSGGRNCGCTNLRHKKGSTQCKTCSHDFDDHRSSSDNDNSDDGSSDNSQIGKPPLNAGNKRIVSTLVSDLIRDGEYTGREVECAQNEARAGLTKKHVGQPTIMVNPSQLTTAQYQMKPKADHDFNNKPPMGNLPAIKSPARILRVVMFPFGKKVSLP